MYQITLVGFLYNYNVVAYGLCLKERKICKFVVKRQVRRGKRPSVVRFVRPTPHLHFSSCYGGGVVSVSNFIYHEKQQNWIGNELTKIPNIWSIWQNFLFRIFRVGTTDYTCCVVCGGGRRELLFDKFFEHLLQYIDRKVEKVIAQPPKRRMPPRSPLRNYLEVVVVDKIYLD